MAFKTAITEWAKEETSSLSDQERKRLGHDFQGPQFLKTLSKLKKHETSTITLLQCGHAPLNHYRFKKQRTFDPSCKCGEGIETVEHFLLICTQFDGQRAKLIDELREHQTTLTKDILTNPLYFQLLANYCTSTWRFKSRWTWAAINDEQLPQAAEPDD